VPDELVDAVALVGPKERIGDQLTKWKASPVTTMLIGHESGRGAAHACRSYACRSSSATTRNWDSTLPGCRHSRTEITQSHLAIEVKFARRWSDRDLRGLRAFWHLTVAAEPGS